MSKNSSNEGGSLRSKLPVANVLWDFHNARLADPSLTEMKPYIDQLDNHYKTIFLELIGEDEDVDKEDYIEALPVSAIDESRNDLRAELRTKIEEKLG